MGSKLSETAKQPPYQRSLKFKSLVAINPSPKGVIQFYGGQLFGQLPATSYDYLLATLYRNGYTLIVTPFEFSFDHCRVASHLIHERNSVYADKRFDELHDKNLTHFWLGHSLGCKFIAMLEAFTDPVTNVFKPEDPLCNGPMPQIQVGIIDQPSLLLAPDISNTTSVLPPQLAFLGKTLDSLGLGIKPTREQMLDVIRNDPLFNLTGLISFTDDTVAGTPDEPLDKSDVAAILDALQQKRPLWSEVPGGHMVPFGVQLHDIVFEIDPKIGFVKSSPLQDLETSVLNMLDMLDSLPKRKVQWREKLRANAPVESGVNV